MVNIDAVGMINAMEEDSVIPVPILVGAMVEIIANVKIARLMKQRIGGVQIDARIPVIAEEPERVTFIVIGALVMMNADHHDNTKKFRQNENLIRLFKVSNQNTIIQLL